MEEFIRKNTQAYREQLELRYTLWQANLIAKIIVCSFLLGIALIEYVRLVY